MHGFDHNLIALRRATGASRAALAWTIQIVLLEVAGRPDLCLREADRIIALSDARHDPARAERRPS
ncbi:hypothetical protein LX81_00255 [Palleronia aestuarii]|uniref:Uncharacterized protein n=1 Tax=Palleronia aestuarii TaxID=568105 RepID=A0A2W7NK14_9RHOB|nr:hypothetical protein [Palleronia aestuarii]PZX19793.1 hypothetical protein LX81_00255 [Palleronia aestuarii]